MDSPFERGLLQTIYNSPGQRFARWMVMISLAMKHGLRGLLFSWPLYLLGFSALVIPGDYALWLLVFLLPGIWVSWKILWPGIRSDYQRYVSEVVFKPGGWKHLLFKVRAP